MAKSITCGMRDLGWMKGALSYIRVLESAATHYSFEQINEFTRWKRETADRTEKNTILRR